VEIGAEAALFPEKEYINIIAVAVHSASTFVGGVVLLLRRTVCRRMTIIKPHCHRLNMELDL
jgi:hypothetical protein